MLYHLVSQRGFQSQPPDQPYEADSLASQGFIHLTAEPAAVSWVANAFYRDVPDLVALCVDEDRLSSPLRYDETPDGVFPHLYGPLNRDAIVDIRPLTRDDRGQYEFGWDGG